MKLTIDKEKCKSHKRCVETYPELFEVDADGKGNVKPEMVDVPEDFEMEAQSAANLCPAAAIEIEY